ncbi:MAG: TRAP transporter small permease subunit [Pseudomonadota bacterium]
MAAIIAFHTALVRVNSVVLAVGRSISWVLMAAMVAVILAQVFYRYVLNDPLSWPEEASLSLMIWMMALMAPTAYRWGGFVAIDMVSDLLPKLLQFILTFTLMAISGVVLVFLLNEAWTQFTSPILFNSSGLNRLLQDSGINQVLGTDFEFRAAYIYFAMVSCFAMMLSVNIELLLRKIGRTFASADEFAAPQQPDFMKSSAGAE